MQDVRNDFEGLINTHLPGEISTDEKGRVLAVYVAFHEEQDRILARNGPKIWEELSSVRVKYFQKLEEVLGPDRFKKLFEFDCDTLIKQAENLHKKSEAPAASSISAPQP